MRRWWGIAAVFAVLVGVPGASAAAQTTELMPGVSYTRDVRTLGGERTVFHVVVGPKPGALYDLQPVLSNGTITGRETVTSMQRRLSGRATVVGVNGDYYNVDGGYPSGIFMRDGVLLGRPTSEPLDPRNRARRPPSDRPCRVLRHLGHRRCGACSARPAEPTGREGRASGCSPRPGVSGHPRLRRPSTSSSPGFPRRRPTST